MNRNISDIFLGNYSLKNSSTDNNLIANDKINMNNLR